jgi:tetratricopeptide (TPR) repeat protein
VHQLRGVARRQHAFSLYYTGKFADALTEADCAETELSQCVVNDFERARLGIVRSLILRAQERWSTGLDVARDSVRIFEDFGDIDRLASARLAEVHMLFSMRDFDAALVILSEQEAILSKTEYARTHAMVLMNIAYAYWQVGRTAESLRNYDAASEILLHLGVETEALRVRWSVATMLADGGLREEALARLRSIAGEFTRLGMTSEAALAGLGVAELLLADEKFEEIELICQNAMRSFELAGISYTARALTALAYMREAATNRVVTPKLVRYVREYIQRLPREENLLFAPR